MASSLIDPGEFLRHTLLVEDESVVCISEDPPPPPTMTKASASEAVAGTGEAGCPRVKAAAVLIRKLFWFAEAAQVTLTSRPLSRFDCASDRRG